MGDEYQPLDPGARLAGTPRAAITAELLGLCDEFFRHASATVHTELRQFLTGQGYHPAAGLGWFIDSVSLAATSSQPVEDEAEAADTRADVSAPIRAEPARPLRPGAPLPTDAQRPTR